MKYAGGRLPMYAWASEMNQKTYVHAADCLCMHSLKKHKRYNTIEIYAKYTMVGLLYWLQK